MFELFKLIWDVVVLRDAARKGQLTWGVWFWALGFVLVEYGIALPAVMIYDKHPEFKPLFIGAMALVLVNFVVFMIFAVRWWWRRSAA